METLTAMNAIHDPQEILSTRDLIAVGMLGDEVRRRMHGARTTFVRVFEIHVEAAPAALPPGVTAGEFRIVGRPASEGAATAAVAAGAALAGATPVTGFSLKDLRALTPTIGSFVALCRSLRTAGLQAIADTQLESMAELADAIRAAREGGLAVERLTVEAMPDDQRIATVERARDLQAAVGGFRAFAPLPRRMSVTEPTTGYDDVKQIALARVVVSNIESIQVDWPLYGPKLAQVALTVGADDVDGIVAVDSGALGTRRSPIEEIKGNIRAAALEAVERNGRFELMS
jgi:CofH/MqnC C-terminal region